MATSRDSSYNPVKGFVQVCVIAAGIAIHGDVKNHVGTQVELRRQVASTTSVQGTKLGVAFDNQFVSLLIDYTG